MSNIWFKPRRKNDNSLLENNIIRSFRRKNKKKCYKAKECAPYRQCDLAVFCSALRPLRDTRTNTEGNESRRCLISTDLTNSNQQGKRPKQLAKIPKDTGHRRIFTPEIFSNCLNAKAQGARLLYRIFKKIKQPGRKTKIKSLKTQPKPTPYCSKNKKSVIRPKKRTLSTMRPCNVVFGTQTTSGHKTSN